MATLIESYPSARALEVALRKMTEALKRPYEPFPDDPSTNLLSATLSSILFTRAMLIDLAKSDDVDLRGSGALRLTIELGELAVFGELLAQEIEDIKNHNPDDLESFLDQVRVLVDEKHSKEQWLALVSGS